MTAPAPARLVDRSDPAFPSALSALAALVEGAGLPTAGLADVTTVVLLPGDGPGGAVAAAGGLEARGAGESQALLLRSVVVAPELQGRGLGGVVVRAALRRGDALRLPVALLTDTAADWYLRFGFARLDRAALPPVLAASAELRGACPATATAMLRPVPGGAGVGARSSRRAGDLAVEHGDTPC